MLLDYVIPGAFYLVLKDKIIAINFEQFKCSKFFYLANRIKKETNQTKTGPLKSLVEAPWVTHNSVYRQSSISEENLDIFKH